MAGDFYASAWRDRVAYRLASVALALATPWYRNFIRGAIIYGLDAALRQEKAKQGDGRAHE